MREKNQERERIRRLAHKLHLAAGCLKETSSIADSLHWTDVQDTAHDLYSRLNILDMAVFAGQYDDWYPNLEDYVEAVQKAVFADSDFNKTVGIESNSPTLSTRKALRDAEEGCDITNVFLNLEKAIRMEFFEFKNKWDDFLKSPSVSAE